jgi:hypothetical protein
MVVRDHDPYGLRHINSFENKLVCDETALQDRYKQTLKRAVKQTGLTGPYAEKPTVKPLPCVLDSPKALTHRTKLH